MAGTSRRYTVVVAAVSLVAAILVAASADEQAAACSISDQDVGSVVERVRNYTVATDKACKETVSRVKLMEGDCLCELRRRVQRHFDTNQDMFMCISPLDMAHCKPTCVIAERVVEYAAEVVKSGTDFKKQVLCDNTVQRALNVGDDCFCELRSRIQAKVGDASIDDELCGLTHKISRCRPTAAPACGIHDGFVQLCMGEVNPVIGGPPPSERVMSVGNPSLPVVGSVMVSGSSLLNYCCVKVPELSAACACEFRRALQQKLGNDIDFFRDLPCITSTGNCAMA